MTGEESEINPESMRIYISETIAQQRKAAIQIRIAVAKEPYRTHIAFEGHKLYNAGVRAIYGLLNMLSIDGVKSVDSREIQTLNKGIEDFLISSK